MKVEYINPFTRATVNVFKNFLNMEISSGKPLLSKKKKIFKDITGVIGLAGDVTGSVVLSFPKSISLTMVENLIMKKPSQIDEEVIDTVGEILNIIVGNAKEDLTEFDIRISLPNVITGTNYDISWPQKAPIISVPFHFQGSEFNLLVSMKNNAR
jgi:chemotaxis protein CheX